MTSNWCICTSSMRKKFNYWIINKQKYCNNRSWSRQSGETRGRSRQNGSATIYFLFSLRKTAEEHQSAGPKKFFLSNPGQIWLTLTSHAVYFETPSFIVNSRFPRPKNIGSVCTKGAIHQLLTGQVLMYRYCCQFYTAKRTGGELGTGTSLRLHNCS